MLDALLPGGSLWVVEDDGDLDKLLDGIAANNEVVREWLHTLARLRSPMLTTALDDLEREFGILPDPTIAELTRRQRLLALKTAVNSDGSAGFIESRLRAAGFDVQVHINNPPVDPTTFLGTGSVFIFGNDDTQFGRDAMIFGTDAVTRMLVNGQVYDNQVQIAYGIPPAEYWHLVFFVGGDATRNGSGELTAIEPAKVDIRRRQELDTLIIRYKPLHSWCGPLFDYIAV